MSAEGPYNPLRLPKPVQPKKTKEQIANEKEVKHQNDNVLLNLDDLKEKEINARLNHQFRSDLKAAYNRQKHSEHHRFPNKYAKMIPDEDTILLLRALKQSTQLTYEKATGFVVVTGVPKKVREDNAAI